MKMQSLFGRLVLAVVTVSILVSGSCSTPSTLQLGTSTTDTKPYGSLTIAVSQKWETNLDPQISSPSTYLWLTAPLFDSLVDPTPDGQESPGLAERWDISPDGMSHTFYIRKGVRFHDGSDLTAADSKFSIDRMLAPEATNVNSVNWRAAIAKVELKDDYTVVIRMKTPQFELLKGLSDFGGTSAVLPKKYIEEKGADYFRQHPMGSGPFRFVKYEPGIRLELEAVDDHWRAVPKFKSVTLLNVPDQSTRNAMLRTGELDIAEAAAAAAPELKSAGLRILSWDGQSQYYMQMFYDLENPQKYAFGDVRVRKALLLAIDRKELADKLVGGYAVPSALLYAPPKSYFFDPNVLKPDPYDPEGAKKLLVEAGYPTGFEVKFWNTVGTVVDTLNQGMAGYWRKIGVSAELTPIEVTTLSTWYRPKHDPKIWPSVDARMQPGGVFGFSTFAGGFHSTKGYWKTIKNAALDELIDKVPATADPAEKKRLALQAAVMAKSEYNSLAILDIRSLLALGPKVGGLTPIAGMGPIGEVLDTIAHPK